MTTQSLDGFYDLCERMRDREHRQMKARKITFALTNLGSHGDLSGALCLDIGCSAGIITHSLSPLFRRIIGLDYDTAALTHLEKSTEGLVEFLRGDGMRLPIASASVDVIICSQVYEHVPNDEKLAAEIFRVLKPGGVVFFSGPNRLFPFEFHYRLPFVHWLPAPFDRWSWRMLGRPERLYERMRTLWELRKLFQAFTVHDVTIALLLNNPETVISPRLKWLPPLVPQGIWKALLPLFPNFNWLLYKPV